MHIIPVGYEYDRIVKPFHGDSGFKANRVYLVSSIEGIDASSEIVDRHTKYVNRVEESLERLGVKVIRVPCNLINILEVIQTISNIIIRETGEGNHVFVNMSGAGRLTSVAVTLPAMAHNVTVYYVNSDGYADMDPRMETSGYTIVNEPKIEYLENFQIEKPEEIQLRTLVEIMRRGSMRTVDIIEFLNEEGFEASPRDYYSLRRHKKSVVMMRLQRNVLDKLIEKGYVTKTKLGREKEYEITETGKYVASISGMIER